MSKCIYRLDNGAFCTKHSSAFCDVDCQQDRGIPCKDKKTLTHYDLLIRKTPEEMAKWLDYEFGRCDWCDTSKIGTDDCSEIDCTACILDWLKQEVNE